MDPAPYTIENTSSGQRLIAKAVLGETEFRAIARALGTAPATARKTGLVAARQAARREFVESHWNGLETINSAEPGDWIATSLSPAGEVVRDAAGHANSYAIKAATFAALYKPVEGSNAFGRFHAATGTVEVLHLSGGFDIIGPWGEQQTAPDGYLMFNGAQVYGNNAETFAATYELTG